MIRNNRLDVVDFLKGFSILSIVLMHLVQLYCAFPSAINKCFSFGGAGVHVFFLCSGFGLYLSQIKHPVNYLEFLKRRFVKVYVPYVVVILITVAYFNFWDNPKMILSHIFLYKMFIEEYENSCGVQMWFVSTIIQFYLFWPIFIRLIEKKWFLITSLAMSLLWASIVVIAGYPEIRIWNSFFLQYLWEFALGAFLAQKYYKGGMMYVDVKYLLVIFVAGIIMTGILGFLGSPFKSYNDVFSLASFSALALLIYRYASLRIIKKIVEKLGQISYELYLTHILVYSVVWSAFPMDWPNGIKAFIAVFFAVVVAFSFSKLLKIAHLK